MTEAEWLISTDLKAMLPVLQGKVSDRKLRLFACAWGQRHRQGIPNQHDQRIIELEERCADGLANMEALVAAYEAAGNDPVDAWDAAHFDPYLNAYYVDAACGYSFGTTPEDIRVSQCGLLREVFGNPFRPAAFEPVWRTPTVVTLGNGIYEERAFDRLPILGDALEEAGCTDQSILAHCRGGGAHMRGCWVIDTVLGKW